ncbi:MAG: chemotaxis protein CheX [Magnetococcales bacterium]|nr:chemotaxis protein CheX [Magnetococcales bacterium]
MNPEMKDLILQAAEDSVMEIVNTMLFVDVTPGQGVAKPSDVPHVAARAEASAMVGMNGGFNGGVRLVTSNKVARVLAGALSGEGYRTLTDEARDGFAELGNMISGGIQTRMEGFANCGQINLTPPTVIVGADYEVDYRSHLESVRKFFRLQDEPFFVEVFYQVDKDALVNVMLSEELARDIDTLSKRLAGGTRAEVIGWLVQRALKG